MKTLRAILLLLVMGIAAWPAPGQVVEPVEEPVGATVEESGPEAEPAEGEAAGEEAEEEHESPLAVVFRWINFAILFGGLGYLLRKPAGEFFEARRQDILGGLERSRDAQEDASRQISAIEVRLSNLSAEVAGIRSDAESSAQREQGRIVADAKTEAGRAVDQSRSEVDRIARGLEQEVRAEIADRVIAQAEQKLKGRLTDEDRGRIVRRAVESL